MTTCWTHRPGFGRSDQRWFGIFGGTSYLIWGSDAGNDENHKYEKKWAKQTILCQICPLKSSVGQFLQKPRFYLLCTGFLPFISVIFNFQPVRTSSDPVMPLSSSTSWSLTIDYDHHTNIKNTLCAGSKTKNKTKTYK